MKTEVLIIGGGVGGLALAGLLGQAGVDITVVEPRKFPIPEGTEHYGRTAALMGGSVNILKALGLWEEIQARTAPLRVMRIIDDSNPAIEPVQIDFPASEIGLKEFGHNVPNMMLHDMLYQKIIRIKNVQIIDGVKLDNFEIKNNQVSATLDNGGTIQANLIVGADGRNSIVRRIAGIKTRENIYNQSAITCLIEHTKPHENISTEHHRAGGPFTTVPMPDKDGKYFSSVVWVEKTQDSDAYMHMDKTTMQNALKIRSRGALGDIKLASHPESWPLKGVIAQDITAPRLALIAEAAHVMSPIGAQGLNLSLRDVATLSETLIDALRLGEDIGGELVLARYAKRRNLDMSSRFNGVDTYNRIVSNNIGLLRGLRRAGLKTLKNIPAFKHLAMQQGLSPMMDEGRVMRGEAL